MFENQSQQQAREEILAAVKEYCEQFHNQKKPFTQGQRIPYASRVYDSAEMVNLVDSALEFWLTAGRYTEEFERQFAGYLGVKYCCLVNSGSSANLGAFMALTSPLLGERQIRRGDEVITVAAGFPTTIAPIVQYGAVPVFVDVTIPQYNVDVTKLEEAYSDRTKAVMLAHTLGNPFDLKGVREFCDRHHLWLIEDNCDALGSEYTLDGECRLTGTWGRAEPFIQTILCCTNVSNLSGTGGGTASVPPAETTCAATGLTGSTGNCLWGMTINMCIPISDTI